MKRCHVILVEFCLSIGLLTGCGQSPSVKVETQISNLLENQDVS